MKFALPVRPVTRRSSSASYSSRRCALVDGLSWRWIFYVNLPVGLLAVAVGALFLPGGSEHSAGRFDLPGIGVDGDWGGLLCLR